MLKTESRTNSKIRKWLCVMKEKSSQIQQPDFPWISQFCSRGFVSLCKSLSENCENMNTVSAFWASIRFLTKIRLGLKYSKILD